MLGILLRLTDMSVGLPPTYWFLWLGTAVNRLGGFVIPFLNLYLTSQRGIPVSQAGLVVSLFGAGLLASHLAGGELADRLGRRPGLLMSLLGAPPLMIALGLARRRLARVEGGQPHSAQGTFEIRARHDHSCLCGDPQRTGVCDNCCRVEPTRTIGTPNAMGMRPECEFARISSTLTAVRA